MDVKHRELDGNEAVHMGGIKEADMENGSIIGCLLGEIALMLVSDEEYIRAINMSI